MATSVPLHPLAVEHLPSFITPPGQTDILFNFVVVFMIAAIFTVGVLYMRLHALPEHLAHGTQKVQYELVAVLALIALFTHNNIFWIAALLLAMIDLPDFLSPLRSMASSLRRMTGRRDDGGGEDYPSPASAEATAAVPVSEPPREPVETMVVQTDQPDATGADAPSHENKSVAREGAN